MVLSGIPQGSTLGPLLFMCFANDMPDVVQAYVRMFADDSKLYRAVNTPEDTEALQTDLTKLEQWALQWQLRFNAENVRSII